MSVHTRQHPTDTTTVMQIVGPAQNCRKVVKAIERLGFAVHEESVPWERIYPESSPKTALRGARYREGLTQRQLAEMTGIPQRHISEMENNKRSIGRKRARILAEALNLAGYKVLL